MIGQTRSEFLKIRSTRTTIGLVIALVALMLLFVLLTGFLSHTDSLRGWSGDAGQPSVAGLHAYAATGEDGTLLVATSLLNAGRSVSQIAFSFAS